MAKIIFSAIVADMRGRLGGAVYSFARGTHYVKDYQPNVSQPNTPRQCFVRGNFSYYSGIWYGLKPTYKQMWRQYASLTGGRITGYNAFMRHNLRLAAAYHTDFSAVLYPPQTVSTPRFPFGISAAPSDSTSNVISWSQPSDDSTYVQAAFIMEWNYASGYNRHWSFIETVKSNVGSITHNHDYEPDDVIYYRLRSIDKKGRVSPYSHSVSLTIPS